MLFIDWGKVGAVLLGLLVMLAAAAAFRCVRGTSAWLRVPVRIATLPVGLLATLLTLLWMWPDGCVSNSMPIYAPNGEAALRIMDFDGGATGGDTSVELFSHHGFVTHDVYRGNWKSVKPTDVQWVNDAEISIHYIGEMYDCSGTTKFKVTCVRVER